MRARAAQSVAESLLLAYLPDNGNVAYYGAGVDLRRFSIWEDFLWKLNMVLCGI